MHPLDSGLIAELRVADMARVGDRGPIPQHDDTPRWRRRLGGLLVRAGQRIERRPPATAGVCRGELAGHRV